MRAILSVVFLAAAAAHAAAQDKDIIRFKEAKRADLEGEVISATLRQVVFDLIQEGVPRAKQTLEAGHVREFVIDISRKGEFISAETAFNNGDYDTAVERADRVRAQNSRASDVVKQMAWILSVRAQLAKGDVNAALSAIKGFRQERPDTFYLRETYELEYQCHLARNDASAIAQVITAFEEKGKLEKLEDWVQGAQVMRAMLLEMQKKWREALAIHRQLARNKDVGDDATLGELRCLREVQDWNGLKSRGEAVLKENKGKKGANERLVMGASNAVGECALQAGQVKDALLHFMRGVAVLSKSGERSLEHETAIARAGVACARFAQAEKEKARKDEYRGRAQELLAELDKVYSGSKLKPELVKAIQDVK